MSSEDKAATLGVPSLIWRAGQARRFEMIRAAAGERIRGVVLDDGCGVGIYVEKLAMQGGRVFGLEFDQTFGDRRLGLQADHAAVNQRRPRRSRSVDHTVTGELQAGINSKNSHHVV